MVMKPSNLRLLRLFRGMSQTELATHAKCSLTTVCDIEKSRRVAKEKHIIAFAKALSVELSMLTGEITVIPVPEDWVDIYDDPRKRTIIQVINSYSSKKLTVTFHEALESIEAKQTGGTASV